MKIKKHEVKCEYCENIVNMHESTKYTGKWACKICYRKKLNLPTH